MKFLAMLGRFPWSLLVVLAMWFAYQAQLDLSGTLGLVFIGFCVFVVVIEFFKSGDIRLGPFFLDLLFSVGAVVAGAALLTYMVTHGDGGLPGFHYLLGGAVVLVDAILSPFNSFRTALRNLQFGGQE
jgi:cation transport ATPase